ncbi:MAG: hypothetical protein HRT68_05315 [Flavobacteriaceae bacterium]|nr:hypothetical protein [Flavobacteriaceae bacterium]
MTEYQKNRLSVINARIERLEGESGFVKKNLLKVILGGVLFSLFVPFYSSKGSVASVHETETIIERSDMSYMEVFIYTLFFYGVLVLLGHIVFTIQEKNQLKKLLQEKEAIEGDIAMGSDKLNNI